MTRCCVCVCADQFEALQEELYQRREECVKLRAMLASRDNQSSQNGINPLIDSEDVDVNELKMAYNSQRELKRSVLLTVTLYRTVYCQLSLILTTCHFFQFYL